MESRLAEEHQDPAAQKAECVLVVKADNSILGCAENSIASRLKEVILSFTQHWRDTPRVLSSLLGSPEILGTSWSKSGERSHK